MSPRRPSIDRRPRGVALVVVLVLLLVMTLVGLASVRSTLLSERISASLTDRSFSFQAAELALREAERAIQLAGASGQQIGFNCAASGVVCPAVPANAFAANTAGCTVNTADCWQNTGPLLQRSSAPAQYYIQYLGQRTTADELGQSNNANANQYGGGGGVPVEQLFRVFGRSADPSIASQRSIVVLQTTVARR